MKADLEGFRLLAEQLRNPAPADEELVDNQGRRWRARSHPAPGTRLILEPLDSTARPITLFEPAAERPAAWPPDLPFVAGAVAAVGDVPSAPPARMVVWSEMLDAEAVARQIQAEGEATGWETTRPLSRFAGFPIAMGESRRGPGRRQLSVMNAGERSAVTLMQSTDADG